MTLRTLLVWSMTATLFAGCSGGAGGVLTSGSPATPVITSGAAALQFDLSKIQSAKRTPKFVGASVDRIAYTFTGGTNPTGTVLLSTCTPSTNTGTGSVYTCNVAAPPFTGYTIAIVLKSGTTSVGTGTSLAPFNIVQGAATPVSIQVAPINAGPALSVVAGQSPNFFMDGSQQSLPLNANELDPAGNIITTGLGPVTNWPAGGLTWADSGGTTGVTLPSSVLVPPSGVAGNTAVIFYDGLSTNVQSLSVSLSDNVNTASSITIPYVSLAAGSSTITVPGTGNINDTVTETITSGTVPDVFFVSIAPTCAGKVNVATAGVNNLVIGGSTATFTYSLTAAHPGSSGSCTLKVASQVDSNLVTNITINYPS